jgi:hypothetical protein
MNNNQKPAGIPLLNRLREGAEALVEARDFLVQNNQGSFEDYINKRAKELDEYILALEKRDALSYAAGEIHLVLTENEHFFLEAEFYFKDKAGSWVKKAIKGKSIDITWAFTQEYQEVIKGKKKITFDYEKPQSC